MGFNQVASFLRTIRANITTNEPGTESQNPSFIVLQSSQLPAAEISRQLQTEEDLAAGQQQEQPQEPAELPAPQPAKTVAAPPRKSVAQPAKSRRPPQQQAAQVSVPVKSRRPAQTQQPIAAPQPAKRPIAAPAKGAIRSRGPSKSIAAPTTTTTTQRPRPVAAPAKRPLQIQQQPAPQLQEEELAQLSQSADQGEEAADEESSQEGF